MVMIRYSLKQLWRMKRTCILFVLFLAFAVLLLTLGSSMYGLVSENMERMEALFVTIGTAEQVPVSVAREKVWDAEIEGYRFRTVRNYGDLVSLSDITLPQADYLSGPERRPYYVSYDPSYRLANEQTGFGSNVILEAEPYEDGIPAGPLRMRQKKVLYSYYPIGNQLEFYFCDHQNPEPERLEAGKTYVMYLADCPPHGWRMGADGPYEWIPAGVLGTDQTDSAGNPLDTDLPELYYEEVTEGFYETERGKRWLELARALDWVYHSVPVTPVSDLNLILPFYRGDAWLIEGKAFEEADYEEERKVCLISRYFAQNNGLKVGDDLKLSLVLASYRGTTSSDVSHLYGADYSFLNAEGKAYEPFEEDDYEVIGIYDWSPGSSRESDYALGRNEVLIPAGAITGDPEDNIAAYGPMRAANTSFCIPNGSMKDYQELWEEHGVDGVELRFYDRGYTELQESLTGLRRISITLLAAGIVTVLLVLVFFCHLLITRQCRRTAIERSMGMGAKSCIISLLTGLLLLCAAGCILGSMAGYRLTEETVGRMETGGHYSTRYSKGAIAVEGNEPEEIAVDAPVNGAVAAVSGIGVLTGAVLLSFFMIYGNLKKEPLALLGGKEE